MAYTLGSTQLSSKYSSSRIRLFGWIVWTATSNLTAFFPLKRRSYGSRYTFVWYSTSVFFIDLTSLLFICVSVPFLLLEFVPSRELFLNPLFSIWILTFVSVLLGFLFSCWWKSTTGIYEIWELCLRCDDLVGCLWVSEIAFFFLEPPKQLIRRLLSKKI